MEQGLLFYSWIEDSTTTITKGHGADVILDMAQAQYARRNLDAVAMDGRIVHLNPGPKYEIEYCAPLAAILTKRACVTGSRLRIASLERKMEIVRQVMERAWHHLGTNIHRCDRLGLSAFARVRSACANAIDRSDGENSSPRQ